MLETLVVLKPREQWPIHPGSGRITREQLVAEMDRALRIPGVSNSWTMPVRGRIDMLATGMRGVLGLKITGATTDGIQRLGERVQSVLKEDSATRSVFAERTGGGYYLDIDWDRDELGRQGIGMEAAQAAVRNAIGGETVTEVIDGRARYPVNVRYLRDFRSDIDALKDVLVARRAGARCPSVSWHRCMPTKGPSRSATRRLLTGYVYIDPERRILGTINGEQPATLASRAFKCRKDTHRVGGRYEALGECGQLAGDCAETHWR
jgi:Cu(I)/Ag(I) efflux system membrane protein CusA/SilA